VYGLVRINLTVDIDGDGVVDGGDVLPLPAVVGTISVFRFKKNGATVSLDTLGNGTGSILHSSLDVGLYEVEEVSFTPGWVRTKGGSFSHNITTSGVSDTVKYMDFKMLTVTGQKFNDLDGDGIKDGGEPGLLGWTVSVSGLALGNTSTTTDSSGNYSLDSVTTGAHVISETPQVGWTSTTPSGGAYPSFNAISGNLPNPVSARDFGNFENVCISGTKYRDKNGDGDQDGDDDGLSGWTIEINPGAITTTTDANGDYSFCDLGPGPWTLTEQLQAGWLQTAPVGGSYVVSPTSGTDVTGQDFGNFKATDSTYFRTFTAAQLGADTEKKPAKRPKVGKIPLGPPNTANLVEDLLKLQGGVIKVGLTGQLNAGGKEKAYLNPAKQGDVFKTLNVKSVQHSGPARGWDMDVKGKLLLKKYKSLPPTKKNSTLVANMVALHVNLIASGLKTPAGLGGLVYNEAGHALNGMTIDQIADLADSVTTNWEGQAFTMYYMLDSVASKINAAFASGSVGDTTDTGGWFSPKLQWKAYTQVKDVPFLKAAGIPARNRHNDVPPQQIPVDFALEQNFPNPFNPTTMIRFDLPDQSLVTLKIYNMLGQEVATLLDKEELAAGEEELEFDASSLSSGVYLYRVVAETITEDGAVSQTYTQVKKMVLLK